jgi:hypothetical protein
LACCHKQRIWECCQTNLDLWPMLIFIEHFLSKRQFAGIIRLNTVVILMKKIRFYSAGFCICIENKRLPPVPHEYVQWWNEFLGFFFPCYWYVSVHVYTCLGFLFVLSVCKVTCFFPPHFWTQTSKSCISQNSYNIL